MKYAILHRSMTPFGEKWLPIATFDKECDANNYMEEHNYNDVSISWMYRVIPFSNLEGLAWQCLVKDRI